MISRLFFSFLFLLSFTIQAQTPTSTISGILDIDASNFLIQSKKVQNMNIDISFRFNKLPNIDGIHTFSRYNVVTGQNDAYIRYQKNFEYTSSSILLENQTRKFSKLDSYNPNGATGFGNAIANGILSLIFD